MTSYNIFDTLTKEVVANRKTLAAARKWAQGLNAGLPLCGTSPRYTVSTLAVVA